jgi:hypothetical protein
MNQYVFEEERPVVDTKCGKIRFMRKLEESQ